MRETNVVPLHSSPYSCPECHGAADQFGDHQVGCGGNADRISRHNAIRDVIFDAAQSAALAPTREAPGVVADSRSRPADILLPTWCRGRPAALDVHVISPLQDLTIREAAVTPECGGSEKAHFSCTWQAVVLLVWSSSYRGGSFGRPGRGNYYHHQSHWESHLSTC